MRITYNVERRRGSETLMKPAAIRTTHPVTLKPEVS